MLFKDSFVSILEQLDSERSILKMVLQLLLSPLPTESVYYMAPPETERADEPSYEHLARIVST